MVNRKISFLYIYYVEIPRIVDHTNLSGPLAEGDAVNLTCTASGEPLPSFQWYKDDVLLINQSWLTIYSFEESEGNNLTESRLELRGLTVNHNGVYSCQADNIAGNASVEFTVEVLRGTIYTC